MINELKLFNKIKFQLVFGKNEGWYTKEEFHDILKKERHRADRNGLPISCVLIDISECCNGNGDVSENEYCTFLAELVKLISTNTRDYDIKYYHNFSKIGILLLDTSLENAKKFITNLKKILYNNHNGFSRDRYLKILDSTRITTYPLNHKPVISKIKTNPEINNRFSFIPNVNDKNDSFLKHKDECIKNIELTNIQQGAVSLSAPFFWDETISIGKRNLVNKILKRLIDIVGSVIGIIIFSPLMLFIAIAIKLTSPGPVLFKQNRMGYSGKLFTFLKFRTMQADCNQGVHQQYVQKLIEGKNDETNHGSQEEPLYKLTNDSRITPLGNILRKTSLDELPQLFNVLVGYMSIVGPRPPISYEVELYKNWHLRRILEVKPGITGLWQVSGRSMTTFEEMVRLDLRYANNMSFLLDIKIILKTFKAVFNTKAAL